MDPYDALKFIPDLTQFVIFAIALLSNDAEICTPISGSARSGLDLEDVHQQLYDWHHVMRIISEDLSLYEDLGDAGLAIIELSRSCAADSDKLLKTVAKLKGITPEAQWKIFKDALKQLWQQDEPLQFEARLWEHKTALASVCVVVRYYLPSLLFIISVIKLHQREDRKAT